MKDRYARILLTVIAVSLAVLALHTTLEFFGSSALAQLSYIGNPQKTTNLDVYVVRDIPIEKIKNVHILGDNKTFMSRSPMASQFIALIPPKTIDKTAKQGIFQAIFEL